MTTAMHAQRPPWLDRLTAEPDKAVDSLLRGVAHLPGLQRASPVEAALALMDEVPPEAPEWILLDHALCRWLQQRRRRADLLLARPGGVQRFVRETGEGFRMAWRVSPSDGAPLPGSAGWIRANFPDLLRWAEDFTLDATFDLGRAVLTAGAYVQQDKELRFLWFRVCEDAAGRRLRHRLDTALLGLSRMPDDAGGGPPSQDLFTGLSRWASRLPDDDRAKADMVREWRALKAAFPRSPEFWRRRWQAILDDGRYDHPFTQWLKEADPFLSGKPKAPKREPVLPKDIKGRIDQFERDIARDGLTEPVWRGMKMMLDQIERFAELTGNSYYLVTSCTSVATAILPHAPGHALGLARRALLWAPSDGHAWSVRARSLQQLGHSDLAISVLWEGMRRAPSNPALPHQLALLLIGRGPVGDAEAEALLRKALRVDAGDAQSHSDLARLLWLSNRAGEGIDLLRRFLERKEDAVSYYMLGSLLVAEGRSDEARGVLAAYRKRYGNDARGATLKRIIEAGPSGQDETRRHLREGRSQPGALPAVPWDAAATEAAMVMESGEARRLDRIGTVAEADLLFRIGGTAEADALDRIDRALAVDDSDAYAHLVKALAVPGHRHALEGRSGRFAGSLPLLLALTPPDAPAERWRELIERFPDGRPLIDLTRFARGIADDDDKRLLLDWARTPARWEDGWGDFLKKQLGFHLEGTDSPALDLPTLEHDALTQAVDVGWDASPRAA